MLETSWKHEKTKEEPFSDTTWYLYAGLYVLSKWCKHNQAISV